MSRNGSDTTLDKPLNTTVSDNYKEIARLTGLCWQRYHSFRLLASILPSYENVYTNLIRSRVVKPLPRCRPTLNDQQNLREIPSNIIDAINATGLTVRRWCNAHNVKLEELYRPEGVEPDIIAFLHEDFPQLYQDEIVMEYKPVPIGCDRTHWFDSRHKYHVFRSAFFNLHVRNRKQDLALKLFNTLQSQAVMMRRLQLLLEQGVNSALSYPSTELLPKANPTDRTGKRLKPFHPEQKALQKQMEEAMIRDTGVKEGIRQLARMPVGDPKIQQVQSDLIQKFGMTIDQVRHETDRLKRSRFSKR